MFVKPRATSTRLEFFEPPTRILARRRGRENKFQSTQLRIFRNDFCDYCEEYNTMTSLARKWQIILPNCKSPREDNFLNPWPFTFYTLVLFINISIRYRIDIRKWGGQAFYRRPLLYIHCRDTSVIIFLFSHETKFRL